jgi:CBS domain-containing protein
MKLAKLIANKQDPALTVVADATVADAIQIMHSNHIGSVMVPSEQGNPLGIITERDVMRLCAEGKGGELGQLTVQDCMTRNVVCGSPDDTVDEALNLMTQRRFRRLPIVANNKLLGLLSIGDLVKAKLEETAQEAQALRDYIAS